MSTISQFSRDSLSSIIVRFVLLAMSASQSIIAARILGPENNGYFALILLIPGFAYSFGWVGISQSINYYSGKYSRDIVLANGFLLAVILGAISTGLAIPTCYFLRNIFFTGMDTNLLLLASSSTFTTFIFYYFLLFALTQKKITLFNALATIQALVNLISLILFVVVLKWGLPGAIAAWITGLMFPIFISLIIFAKNLRHSWQLDTQLLKLLMLFGLKSHFFSVERASR